MPSGVFFLDLKKTFDTFNHTIPLSKLVNFGFSHTWMENYLTDKCLVTKVDNYLSDFLPNYMNFGTSQRLTTWVFPYVHNSTVDRVNNFKCMGVTPNSQSEFDAHVAYV